MSSIDLTITPGYAADWDYIDAVRELFQNALDQETVETDNKMFFEYEDDVLMIGNKKSVLECESLLLGATTKQGDDRTIGQFGEGYKIAMLVLTRLGHPMVIYNYGHKETWTPRLKKSRRFGVPILCVDVKRHIWSSVPHNNLVIEIRSVTQDMYDAIVESNLNLHDSYTSYSTMRGRILLEEQYAGKVYVSGLYIDTNAKLKYGYDIKPSYLKLGRDRKLVSDFDLSWETSAMWGEHRDTPEILTLFESHDHIDCAYYASTRNAPQALIAAFSQTHGDAAMPACSQTVADELRKKYDNVKVVMVPQHTYNTLKFYSAPGLCAAAHEAMSLHEWLRKAFRSGDTELFETLLNDFVEDVEGLNL